MEWYNNKFANFSGRATRSEYRSYILIYVALFLVIFLLYWMTKNNLNLIFNLCVFQLASFVPMQAVTIRRLKDLGMKWSFSLLIFLPFFNLLLILYLLLSPGQRGENQYGEDPKMSSQIVEFN
jgi:uncharacterized membrane protein YhaH (DUF805 family)